MPLPGIGQRQKCVRKTFIRRILFGLDLGLHLGFYQLSLALHYDIYEVLSMCVDFVCVCDLKVSFFGDFLICKNTKM